MHVNNDINERIAKENYDYITKEDGDLYVPNYIMKSVKNRSGILAKPKELDGILFRVKNKNKNELKSGARRYIEWGLEHEPSRGGPFPERDNTGDDLWVGDSLWYDVEQRSGSLKRNLSECYGDLIWPRTFFKRMFVLKSFDDRILATDSFYAIQLDERYDAKKVCAILNSTMYNFLIEIKGRVNLGEGALTNMSSEVQRFPIIDPDALVMNQNFKNSVESLLGRKIKSIYDEIGTSIPKNVSFDKVKNDRRIIDKKIMGDLLGMSEEEQLQVYKGLIDVVGNRIKKSKSE